MEYEIVWGGDPEDVSLVTSGGANVADMDAMWRAVVADPRWGDRMSVLLDSRRTDLNVLTASELEERAARFRAMAAEVGCARIAAVVGGSASYHAARMVGFRMDWEVPFTVRFFTSPTEARDWLRQPADHQAMPHISPRP